uniref:carbohydrate-binding family 9-like protein n=2 Tax=Roseivirga sp. TaxID=1964215 RepID=UPI00404841FF
MRSIQTTLFLLFITLGLSAQNTWIQPKYYIVHKVTESVTIDGKANETAWSQAKWTEDFIDIEGDKNPQPYLKTRVKMLWDTSYLYFFAELEEPHIWATITKKDEVIFHDNDFEIFIDPNGDTHNYFEFEVNALNTVWDLMLTKPYRDGGNAIDNWDVKGLKTAVNISGSINNPNDIDKGWSIEIAIPLKVLKEGSNLKVPPKEGDAWRINFSRVQWETEIINDKYAKRKVIGTDKNLPENNWVWSQQDTIAMHEPEFWGMLYFSEIESDESIAIDFDKDLNHEKVKQALYQLHRAQVANKIKNKVYLKSKKSLIERSQLPSNREFKWELTSNGLMYWVKMTSPLTEGVTWYIDHTGLIRKEVKQ